VAERVVSLVPAATEILFELGLGEQVKAVSHACDFPPKARKLPEATRVRSHIDPDATSSETDRQVREAAKEDQGLYEVLGEVLHHAQPDIVVTQEACEVCGITPVDVQARLARFEPVERPEILALHPHALADVFDTVETLAEAVDEPETGRELARDLRRRVDDIRAQASPVGPPRVAVLDWVDPPMAAGHWVPDMVQAAGGEPALVTGNQPSTYVDADAIVDAAPDRLVLAPCGYGTERAAETARASRLLDALSDTPAVENGHVYAVDGDSHFSRPGPRVVEGVERLAAIVDGTAADVDRVRRLDAPA
jgi:iron complex transport system substrate-binding protein